MKIDSYLDKNQRINHHTDAQLIFDADFITYFCVGFDYTMGTERFGLADFKDETKRH
jgi:hypothetical protein